MTIELIATVFITGGSVLLFAYWFRYTCLLILSAKTAQDYAVNVAASNRLGFLAVQAQLQYAGTQELEGLRVALDNDYKVVRELLQKTGAGQSALETNMLAINFKVMEGCYKVSRHFSGSAAAKALEEMSMVVAHLANVMGEQSSCSAAA